VEQTLGGNQDDWLRVFLMPGMGHCRGGRGPDRADFVAALDGWRDGGVAPARIDASKMTNGKVEMTRPLCAYPQVARYKGTGSTTDATNFSCAQ
jgi:feruloyl esterase